MEYCDLKNLYQRETYYIQTYQPEYNLLKEAYSSLGYTHTEESLKKMKGPRPNFKVSEENKELIRKIHKNKKVSQETKQKIAEKKSRPVYVSDLNKNLIKKYNGIVEAKKELKISTLTIHKYAQNGKPYKKMFFSYE